MIQYSQQTRLTYHRVGEQLEPLASVREISR